MASSLSACPAVGPCILAAFDAVYKAAENYPEETFRVSKTVFKTINVAGPLALATLNLGSQALGWKWTQEAYDRGILNEEGEKSAGHKYVPFMLATGAVSLIQTTTGLIAGSPYPVASDGGQSYPAVLNSTVSAIMRDKSCAASGCAAKIGESLFNCTLNFFVETFTHSNNFNVATWINSDVAKQLYQIGGVNMVASGLILGLNFFQAWNEVKVTKTVNPVTVMACCFAAFMFLNGLVQVYYGTSLPYEENVLREWKKCEVIS